MTIEEKALARLDEIEAHFPSLSAREHEFLLLLAIGCTYKEIATSLSMTLGATKMVVDKLLKKLGLPTRTHVTFLLYEKNILPDVGLSVPDFAVLNTTLSEQLRLILTRIAEGELYKVIGLQLDTSEECVKTHAQYLFRFFGCNQRYRLAYLYLISQLQKKSSAKIEDRMPENTEGKVLSIVSA